MSRTKGGALRHVLVAFALFGTLLWEVGFTAAARAEEKSSLPGKPPLPAKPQRFATDVRVTEGGGTTTVVAEFSSPPTFSARLVEAQKRLLIDVPGTGVRGAPAALQGPVGVVAGVMTQSFDSPSGATTRIVVTLNQITPYEVKVDGQRLVVEFGNPTSTGSDRSARVAPVPKPAATIGTADVAHVRDVTFDHEAHEDRVVVDLSSVPAYRVVQERATRERLVLGGSQLPAGLERRLEVAAFGGSVASIASYQASDGSGVVIEVDKARGTRSRVLVLGTKLVWSFFTPGALPSAQTGVAADGGVARRTRTIGVEAETADLPLVESSFSTPQEAARAEPLESNTSTETAAFNARVSAAPRGADAYGGRRIDLDLKDADIHNVLRLLAEVGRVNVITSDDVGGTITIRMRNVPWDQALDVVLQAKQLGLVRRDNIIRVAPLAELEKEREIAVRKAKQELQLAPLETRLIPVSYAAAADIVVRVKELLSNRGSASVDTRTNVIIARDVTGSLDQIEELVHSLDTQTPQVLVEARIVEATSRYVRDIGIQWGGDASFSAATGNPTGLAFPNSVGLAGGASDGQTPTAGLSPTAASISNPNFAVNLPAAVGTGAGGALGLAFGSVDGNYNLNLRLSAAETSGMLRILSSPRVLTLDNTEARISQGTLIPFSQVSAQGVQTTFQEAKLQLLVKPHVTADGSVSMRVKINRDDPDFNQTSARGDPTILKREAETNLLVMDGHTAVIGGIYTRNSGRNLDQVPFFGDIPLLGILFQHRRSSDTRGEMVIFLTPRIVNRAEALGR